MSFRQFGIWALICLLLQFFREYIFWMPVESDRLFQVMVGHNLFNGLGPVAPNRIPDILGITQYHVAGNFPLGYSLLFILIYWISGNWAFAIEFLHLFSHLALFLSLALILWHSQEKGNRSPLLICLFMWGVSFAPWEYAGTTDLIAAGLLFVGIWFWTKSEEEPIGIQGLGAFAFLGLAAFMRYAYYAYLIFPFAFSTVIHISAKKNGRLWENKSISTALQGGIFTFLPLYLLQKSLVAGSSYFDLVHEPDTSRWIYPEHLLHTENFLMKAFWYISTDKIAYLTGANPTLLAGLAWICSLFILVYLAINLRYNCLSPREKRWLLSFGLISFLTLVLLVNLSLTKSPQYWGGKKWTYVQESRYYLPIMLLLILAWGIISRKGLLRTPARRLYWMLTFILMLYMGVHTLSRYQQIGFEGRIEDTRQSLYWKEMNVLSERFREMAERPGTEIFVMDFKDPHGYPPEKSLAGFHGIFGMDLQDFLNYQGAYAKPLEVYFLIKENDLSQIQSHLREHFDQEMEFLDSPYSGRVFIKLSLPDKR